MSRKYPKDTPYIEAIKKNFRLEKKRQRDKEWEIEEDLSTFGGQLKYVRKEKGMTQSELSEKTGISQKLISEYENNKREPEKKNRDKLVQVLDFNPFQASYTSFENDFGYPLHILKILLSAAKNDMSDLFLQCYGYQPQDVITGLEFAIKELEKERQRPM